MATIKHEAPDQRRHYRSRAPISVQIGSSKCMIHDWSLGGFLINEYKGPSLKVGANATAAISVHWQSFDIAFTTDVEVVRLNGKSVGVRFTRLEAREKEVLGQALLASTANGERASLMKALADLDPAAKATVVTPVSMVPTARESTPPNPRNQFLRRAWMSAIYWGAGLALGAMIVTVMYFHFFRLDLEYSVVSLPLYPVVSQDVGRCAELLVREGDVVKAGQPLLRLEDDVLTRDLELAELQLASSKSDLATGESRVAKEQEKLALYEHITKAKLASNTAQVDSYTRQLEANKTILDRELTLMNNAVGAVQVVNQTQARVAELEGLLLHAQAEKRIAETSLDALKHGSFYDQRHLVGDMSQYEVNLADARQRIRLAEQRVTQTRDRVKRLTYLAPFDGKVVKLMKAPGSVTNRGEVLVVVEKVDDKPVIDAFVTQDEANTLRLGGKAAVWVPALNRSFNATVVKIDRTSGFLTEMQSHAKDFQLRYNWRGQQDRSAYVQLALEGELPIGEGLAGGMPATVSIAAQPAFWQRIRITLAKLF